MKRNKTININRILLISFFMFLVLGTSKVRAQEELDNYLVTAAENNPGLKAAFNDYMAALQVAPQVKALPDPQVAFAYFISPVETRMGPQQYKFSASQMFPWFGTLKAKESLALQAAKAKYERFEEMKSKLFNDVKSAYFDLYFNQKAVIITNENIEILMSFQSLANIKIEAGLVSSVDEYRIEMELNELKNQLALLNDKANVLTVAFNNLLNTDHQSAIQLPDDLWTTDLAYSKEAVLDSIAHFNHQLLSIDMQQAALAIKKDVAGLMGKPKFKIGVDYTIIGKGENNLSGKDAFVFPMVGISIPLYRNKYKAMVQEAVYEETAKSNERINKANMLETLFEKSWKDYQDARRRIVLYTTQLDLAQKSINILETDYSTGSKNFEEVLRMERKLLRYHLEKEKAKADKQAAIAFIEYLMGK